MFSEPEGARDHRVVHEVQRVGHLRFDRIDQNGVDVFEQPLLHFQLIDWLVFWINTRLAHLFDQFVPDDVLQ